MPFTGASCAPALVRKVGAATAPRVWGMVYLGVMLDGARVHDLGESGYESRLQQPPPGHFFRAGYSVTTSDMLAR